MNFTGRQHSPRPCRSQAWRLVTLDSLGWGRVRGRLRTALCSLCPVSLQLEEDIFNWRGPGRGCWVWVSKVSRPANKFSSLVILLECSQENPFIEKSSNQKFERYQRKRFPFSFFKLHLNYFFIISTQFLDISIFHLLTDYLLTFWS